MDRGIVIRKAEEGDVGQIAEILVEDWKTAYRGIIDGAFLDSMSAESRYEIEIKRFRDYIVADDGNAVLGYAWLRETDEEGADCEIVALYVRYARRKNGIGKLLLRDALRRFREMGKKSMIVWCLKENIESGRFYEKTGGKEFRSGSHRWGGREYEMISYLYDIG